MRYSIDLDQPLSKLKIKEYPNHEIKDDLIYFNKEKFEELADPDFKVFKTKKSADKYLKKYLNILNNLDNKKICNSKKLPNMLYRRRYIVQALLKEKNCTVRHYKKKNLKKGDLFNLYDQTNFLTVKLTELKHQEDGSFLYKYKLIK